MHIMRQANCTPGDMVGDFAHVHHVHMPKTAKPHPKPQRAKTFLREWRNHKGFKLEPVAEELGMTHASLSRIERGLQPYNQDLLEAVSNLYGCSPADLLMRDPESAGIWSLWELAREGERKQIIELAKVILSGRAGTGG